MEASLHSHWSGCDNHERNSLPKAITAAVLWPPVRLNEGEPVLMAAAPRQGLENADGCDFSWSCMWMDLPSLFLLSKIQPKFLSKIIFLCIALLLSTFTSSATVVFNYPLRVRNTDESAFRMQTRMMARDHSYFLLDSCPTSHLFPDTATTTLLPMSGIKPIL